MRRNRGRKGTKKGGREDEVDLIFLFLKFGSNLNLRCLNVFQHSWLLILYIAIIRYPCNRYLPTYLP